MRFEEGAFQRLVSAFEVKTGARFSEEERSAPTRGAGEEDLVNSGLEETMASAFHQVRETQKRYDGKADLRTAAFITAIDKISLCCEDLGFFP